MKTFGELIARRRKELGLTQSELGARIKGRSGEPVSQKRITDIEHDRFGVPRAPVLKQLARALKLDVDVLYFWVLGAANSAGHSRGRAFRGGDPGGLARFSCGRQAQAFTRESLTRKILWC